VWVASTQVERRDDVAHRGRCRAVETLERSGWRRAPPTGLLDVRSKAVAGDDAGDGLEAVVVDTRGAAVTKSTNMADAAVAVRDNPARVVVRSWPGGEGRVRAPAMVTTAAGGRGGSRTALGARPSATCEGISQPGDRSGGNTDGFDASDSADGSAGRRTWPLMMRAWPLQWRVRQARAETEKRREAGEKTKASRAARRKGARGKTLVIELVVRDLRVGQARAPNYPPCDVRAGWRGSGDRLGAAP